MLFNMCVYYDNPPESLTQIYSNEYESKLAAFEYRPTQHLYA